MLSSIFFFFFFNDTATTEIYTLSLHDALPILCPRESATAHHFRNSGVRWRLHRRPWPGCLGGLRTRLRIRRRPGAPSGLFALGIAQEGRRAGGRPLSREHVLLGRFSPTGTDAHRPVAIASDRFRVENSPLGVTAPNEASNPSRPLLAIESRRQESHLSSTIAMASPPPMHKVASPRCTSFSFIECNSVTTIRFPEQPIGWPRATAPPQMLKTSHGMPSSFLTPTLADEKASLCSTKSNSSSLSPVRFISFRTHGIGANITSSGFTAWEQKSRIAPSGSTPISRARRSLISTVALAPSEIWDELPAVSTPSFLNTGGSLAKASRVESGRIPPSRFTVTSFPSIRVSTGTISFAKRPDSVA